MTKWTLLIALNTFFVFLSCSGAMPPAKSVSIEDVEAQAGDSVGMEGVGVEGVGMEGVGVEGVGSGGIGIGVADASSCPCGICPDGSHEFAPDVPFPSDYDTLVEEPGLEDFLKALTSGGVEIESIVHWEAAKKLLAASRIESGGPEFKTDERVGSLASALGAIPGGCTPRFEVGGGYEMMAIPPAMTDNTDKEAAIIDAAVNYLQTGNEVSVTCMYHAEDPEWDEESDAGPTTIQEPRPALMLNVIKDSSGEWKVTAWAAMHGAFNGVYPD